MTRRRLLGRAVPVWMAGCLASIGLSAVPVAAHDLDHPLSTGSYRIPYADGEDVDIFNDEHDHNPDNRVDMGVGFGTEIVAAASGIIRAVVDGYGGPGDEGAHSCQNDNAVDGNCTDHNNYVWIEHPNGEWTKYTHLETDSVSGNGWVVGASIDAGDVLGLESDVGFASGPHLHFEVGLPTDPADLTPFTTLGGYMVPDFGINLVARICDIGTSDGTFDAGATHTANPCNHLSPTADAGGPYQVDEGSSIGLDGTGSSDPESRPLTFLWEPAAEVSDPAIAAPSFAALDDAVLPLSLTVYDQVEALSDSDSTTVTVLNVDPTVGASVTSIDEGGQVTLTATVTDPGTLDTHTALVNWGDGTLPSPVLVTGGPGGSSIEATHVYGDDGPFPVTVTVTDDDGGVGAADTVASVANLDPMVTVDTGDAVSFPGGDYFVVAAGGQVAFSATGSDAGSDDLTFAWSAGGTRTYFNDGVGPDPALSPAGTFPFVAVDVNEATFHTPGTGTLALTVSDDDDGSAGAALGVIVTGTATRTEGQGWWKHQYSGSGQPHIDPATAQGYLDVVNAVSSVFFESRAIATMQDAHAVLSPTGGARRPRAEAQLLLAWLELASGAVAPHATINLASGPVDYLDLMTNAEAVILNPASTPAQLHAVEKDLARVR